MMRQVLAVLEKMVKQRRESITQFEAGGRADLVAKEQAELRILQGYLPAQMSAAEIDALIAEAIASDGRSLDQGHGQGHGSREERRRRAAPTWVRSAPASNRS